MKDNKTIYGAFIIICVTILIVFFGYFYSGCKNIKNIKEPVIVQETCERGKYYHVFYRRISNWEYGKLDVGRYDFDNISVGDTLYLTFK